MWLQLFVEEGVELSWMINDYYLSCVTHKNGPKITVDDSNMYLNTPYTLLLLFPQ